MPTLKEHTRNQNQSELVPDIDNEVPYISIDEVPAGGLARGMERLTRERREPFSRFVAALAARIAQEDLKNATDEGEAK